MSDINLKKESKAIKWAIISAAFWTVIKFAVWLTSGSMSMVSSAVDSSGDLIVSIMNFFIVRTSNKGPDEDHNYWHSKLEGLWAMFEWWFIFAAWLFIVYESIHNYILNTEVHSNALSLSVMWVLTIITFFTVIYLRRIAKETDSLVIKSDALHYTTDLYVNIWVFISLILVKLTQISEIDSIVSLGIALYMLYSSTHIIREWFDILMDKALPKEDISLIEQALDDFIKKEIKSYHNLKTRIGKVKHVEFHIIVDEKLNVKELHDIILIIKKDVQEKIKWDSTVHVHTDYIERWVNIEMWIS